MTVTNSAYQYDAQVPYDASQPYDFVSVWGGPGGTQTVIPHLSADMKLAPDGTFSFLQQNTIDEVAQCVEVICDTQQGDRTVVPGFGLPALPFTVLNSDTAKAVEQAILTWEPRANVSVGIKADSNGNPTITVSTSVRRGSTT